MSIDAAWDFYLSARGAALRNHADADGAAVAIERARARLKTHFDMMDADATITARRSFVHNRFAASAGVVAPVRYRANVSETMR